MNRRALAALVLFLTAALPLHADFASIARAIDAKDGVKRTWIPFLSFARAVVWMVEPHGVNDFQLVVFEGAERLDGRDLQAIMQREVGAGFTPLVQVRSRAKGEWSFIYARPSANGKDVELIILAHDDDTVLVRVNLDADVLVREFGDPRNVTRMARR